MSTSTLPPELIEQIMRSDFGALAPLANTCRRFAALVPTVAQAFVSSKLITYTCGHLIHSCLPNGVNHGVSTFEDDVFGPKHRRHEFECVRGDVVRVVAYDNNGAIVSESVKYDNLTIQQYEVRNIRHVDVAVLGESDWIYELKFAVYPTGCVTKLVWRVARGHECGSISIYQQALPAPPTAIDSIREWYRNQAIPAICREAPWYSYIVKFARSAPIYVGIWKFYDTTLVFPDLLDEFEGFHTHDEGGTCGCLKCYNRSTTDSDLYARWCGNVRG